MPRVVFAQAILPTSELKKLSVEELMNIEVTSVSRHAEKLSKTASAIQVITREDIERFGATRLPEALRLASNLEVVQVDGGQWSVSARGFNSSTANKLLVLIDGRTVYSPLFAGVFWDIQDVLLDDIERIEVISGPGGTLWGVNAVNGVINIITKSAKNTNGFLLKAAKGTQLKGWGAIRYGAAITPKLNFRAYGKYTGRNSSVYPDGTSVKDDWNMEQSGMRMDYDNEKNDVVTIQSDVYKSKLSADKNDTLAAPTTTDGFNALGRWTHNFSERSDFKIQAYYDRVHRSTSGSFNDILNTYDLDCQYRFSAGNRHDIIGGIGYRLVDDDFQPGKTMFIPEKRKLNLYSAFIQDEISIVKEKLFLILGSKIQHNDYTGYEIQPSIRTAWNLSTRKQQTLWAAVSRAVRMPSRVDRDFVTPPYLLGGPNFRSEVLIAYELGYRIQPHEKLSTSIAAYFNDYQKIRSVEQANPPAPFPVILANNQTGQSYGGEVTADYQVNNWWRLRLGYTYINVDIWAKPGSTDKSRGSTEANDPNHMFFLRSSFDLPAHFKFFPNFRYVSKISTVMNVPAYCELDARLAWQPRNSWDLSLVGQNLLHDHHAEFGNAPTAGAPHTRKEIQRNVYIKFQWRY
jgi:iron complex outermembrane receptor protein